MSNSMRSNNDHAVIKMRIAERKSENKNTYVMLIVKVMLAFMTIIGTLLVMDKQTTKSNQRHLNAEAAESTLPFFGRMQGGELIQFDVRSLANLNDVYQEIGAATGCIVGSLIFNGRALPNDEKIFVADVGICAECIIDVLPPNDLQILDRAIENPNEYLWPQLMDRGIFKDLDEGMWTGDAAEGISEEVRCALHDVSSYASFETAAKSLEKDVMKLAEECFRDKIFKIEQGKIVSIDTDNLWDSSGYHKALINFDVLAQLTQLSKLKIAHRFVPGSEIDLSALGRMKQLKVVKLYFHNSLECPEERLIIIPDLSDCRQLNRIEVSNETLWLRLTVDSRASNLGKSKIMVAHNGFDNGIFRAPEGIITILK